MLYAALALFAGLAVLVWSADRFVHGAAAVAGHFGMPPLLIGMVVVGFGTSAPELVVSVLAATQGNAGLALGNAYGSNIGNIGLILGISALLTPIAVHSNVLRKELPILLAVTLLAAWQVYDGHIARSESWLLLGVFGLVMGWSIWQGLRKAPDAFGDETAQELRNHPIPLRNAVLWLVIGLVALILSSRVLVWGAVEIATAFGVSDLVIGLTVVAIGTSLPELASSLIAVKRGEHDIALGNVLGSNLFNTLAVVGVAGVIQPLSAGPEIFQRDMLTMLAFTAVLFVFGYGFRGPARINRFEGGTLVLAYLAYNAYLLTTQFSAH
ncbi:MAG: calcium/sodium antiporter [Aquimonas sp.]|jgi:cation:H+ antiporter|nr:calcium/sodium antiporter [Aquimonas sp.]